MTKSYSYPNFPEEYKFDELHLNRYIRFIESRKLRALKENAITEKHHIIPKSLKGSNKNINIIPLTPREHYIAHMILWKACGGPMTSAFFIMVNTHNKDKYKGIKINARMYQSLKEDISKQMRERIVSEETRKLMSILAKERQSIPENTPNYGRKPSLETRKLISDLAKERMKDPNNNPMYGKKHTEETKQILREKSLKYHKENVHPFQGKTFSDEHIENLRKGAKRYRDTLDEVAWKERYCKNTGKTYIYKGEEEIYIKEELIEDYLARGYKKGRNPLKVQGYKRNSFFVEKEKEFLELYLSGIKVMEISRRLKINHQTICSWRDRYLKRKEILEKDEKGIDFL